MLGAEIPGAEKPNYLRLWIQATQVGDSPIITYSLGAWQIG